MDKQQLLLQVSQMSSAGELSEAEVLAALKAPGQAVAENSRNTSLTLSNILYYIGGAIVFLGISVLVYQNWDSFGSPLRILVTLGSCLAALVAAALLERYPDFQSAAQAFFLLGGMLAPLGVSVTFNQGGFDLSSSAIGLVIYLILTAAFLGLFWFYKRPILLFFGVIFATSLFHFIIASIIGNGLSYTDVSKVWEYQFLVIGLAYILIGYYLTRTSQKVLTGVAYGFGSLLFLGSAMALGGWQPNQNAFWELVYPLLVFGLIFLSVYLKSKSLLVFGTLFLIAYILKITGEYFTSGLGWPLALVIAGLLIMVVGYYAVRINKKYLTSMTIK